MRLPDTLKATVTFLVLCGAVVTATIIACEAIERATAHADTPDAGPTELRLAKGQKLVDVSWRCFGDYPCAPFTLTRAMRKDETPETYAFSSPDPDVRLAYVIKESR